MLSFWYHVHKCYSEAFHAMRYGVGMPKLARPKQNKFEQLSIGQGQKRCTHAHMSQHRTPQRFFWQNKFKCHSLQIAGISEEI